MKKMWTLCLCGLLALEAEARTYYISPQGNDNAAGTLLAAWATFPRAQRQMVAGDTLFMRGGRYAVDYSQVMRSQGLWTDVFVLDKSGTPSQPISYLAYPGERPQFDLSAIKPEDQRVIVFLVTGSYLRLRGFDVMGTQVTIKEHTQSECFHNEGSFNEYDFLSMHDGMGIGFYLTHGRHNVVKNCDAYRNYDSVSEGGRGGNVDGFGCHPQSPADSCNSFIGCRAWLNSDDGFDLINAHATVSFIHCYAFLNGYRPDGVTPAADGNGFKAGGYGMSQSIKAPLRVPRHVISRCIASENRANGFYANHHLDGDDWMDNKAEGNTINYNMVNRVSASEVRDVDGYGHRLLNNLSYRPRKSGAD